MTILIVDDDADVRQLLLRIAAQEGLGATRQAASVDEALSVMDEGDVDVQAVIMDYAMPGRDGIEGCRAVLSHPRGQEVPVIVTATENSAAARVAARQAGAVDFVPKPFDRDLLCAAVRKATAARAAARDVRAMMDDVGRAAAAQRDLLRAAPRHFGGMALTWRMVPGSGLSGDYINFFPLDGNRLGFCLADVVGHGIGSALFAVSLHGHLSPSRRGSWVCDDAGRARAPDEVAALANRDFPQVGGDRYFTLIYGVVDPERGRLQCVQAGHPGLILCQGGAGEVLAGGDLPIGMFVSASYHTIDVQLTSGARLLVYSDGLIEARRGGHGEAFGQQRLLELVRAMAAADGEHVADEILRSVRAWLHPACADDDQSLLLLSLP